METTQPGSAGPVVLRAGLGCMGMFGMYGPADRAESIANAIAEMVQAGYVRGIGLSGLGAKS